jgi:hypothetical protein
MFACLLTYLLTQLHKKSRTALQWAADSFITTTCTPDDGRLGPKHVVTRNEEKRTSEY